MGLPSLLLDLSHYPGPDEAMAALVTGPLARFEATTALLWIEQDGALVMIGSHTEHHELPELYSRMGFELEVPATRAFLEAEVIITPAADVQSRYPGMDARSDFWQRTTQAGWEGSLIDLAIINRGVSAGVVGVLCRQPLSLDTLDVSFLDGVGAALGLWLTHPNTPLMAAHVAAVEGTAGIDLTSRQRRILQLVLDGHSNAAIAVHLGCSVSTVKQDIQRAQRNLHAPDRLGAAERAWELGAMTEQALSPRD